MKNNILKLFALIMVLAMFVSAMPFASADVSTELPEINEDGSLTFPDGTIVDGEGSEGDEGETTECTHAFTETDYIYGANGSHTKVVTCTAALCLKEISRSSEPCTAGADGKCTLCGAEVPAQGGDEDEDDEDDDTCKHTDVDTKYTAKSGGKHTKTVTCKAEDCDYTSTTTEDCTANNEGKCIHCGAEVEDNNVSITCAQDGDKTSGDSITMRFVISGVDTDDISWTFSASGSAEPDLSTTSGSGKSVSTTVYGEQGTARVSVKATWDGGSESATFSVSFYGGEDHIAVLEDNVSKFDFDDVGVFAKVDGTSSGASRKSMYTLLTDGVGTRVILSETKYTSNSRVGKITYDGSSLFDQYDPKDNNDYSLTELEKLSFEVVGTGEYVLNYELFENSMLTSSGSVTIVTGEVAADIEYTVKAAGSTQFKVKDFENFWKKYGKSGEDLSYVTFEVSTTSDFNGALTYGKDTVKSTWKFFVDYDEDKANTYDLSKVVYQASAMEKNYTDQFNFTAYGKNGTKATGVVGVTVTNAKMSFSDVTSADWFYDEVYNVWVAGIMNGTDDKTFSPSATLTRGMVVTMLYRLEDSPATAARGTFSDVASGEWYAEAVEWAAKNDIVNGVGNDKFAPNDPITREQLATILYRYTTEYKNDTSATSGSLTSFGDADKVSAYAEDALRWAVGAKIITGDAGNLKPQGNATRAEAAAMFSRFMAL